MEDRVRDMALLVAEVPMVEAEVVRQMRTLAGHGWGAKRIARELGVARNTVRRYVRGGEAAETQVRLGARCLDEGDRTKAVELFDGAAEGNAVVVQRLLADDGVEASVRTVQRAVVEHRQSKRVAQVATVRYETAPGHQMQVDFGQKLVSIGGALVRVYLLVAVLSYSRRLFVKAFLAERTEDWLEGIAEAFRRFGGVPRTVLGDNARALVVERDRGTATVKFTPAYLAFCRDWDTEPRACAPYRARTKGKTESGVKYVKRNGLAGRAFASFAAMCAHLEEWVVTADGRVHGTTHEKPSERFERDEAEALRPLPARPLPLRERRLRRRVANDALVDVDTVRYSVPHRLVRESVEVAVGATEVRIFRGAALVATHRRSLEPHSVVRDQAHYAGLWRSSAPPQEPTPKTAAPSPLGALGRSLEDYAAVVGGAV
jgi:transposase